MDFLGHFGDVFQTTTILLLIFGTVVGIILGATPGLSSTFAVAVMLPLTLSMQPLSALVFLGAVLMGSTYGGAIPAILLNTPGTPQSITTTFDGFQMTKNGEGGLALTIALIASAVAGLVGVVAFITLAPPLAQIALSFGPAEMFWLGLFGLTIIASLSRGNVFKGLVSGCIGLTISMIGIAVVSADSRFTFGITGLAGGVHIIPATVGLLCIPVLIDMMGNKDPHISRTLKSIQFRLKDAWAATVSRTSTLVRGSTIGTVVGVLPGAGGAIASLLAYSSAKRSHSASKETPAYGHGNPGGVLASESANNATVGSSLVPTFVLGIPGSPPDAVILAALLIHGLQIGPSLFTNHSNLVFSFTSGMILASLLLIPIGLLLAGVIYRTILRAPKTFIVPTIAFMTIVGAYAIRNNYFDVIIMVALGAFGWLLTRFGFPMAPIVLGILLGPIIEQGFSQTFLLASARGDFGTAFLGSGISLLLVALIVLSIAAPILKPFSSGISRRNSIYWIYHQESFDHRSGQGLGFSTVAKRIWTVHSGASLISIALGLIVLHQAQDFSRLGSFMPNLVGSLFLILGILFLVLYVFGVINVEDEQIPTEGTIFKWSLIAVLIGWTVAIPLIGFLTSALISFLAILLLVPRPNWTKSVSLEIATGTTVIVGIYFLLSYVLDISFTKGLLI